MSSSVPSRLKSMLVDLGKPTLRGIRQCPKCRTVNGTRSSSCKNKQCDAVFKEQGAERQKKKVECVKVNFVFCLVALPAKNTKVSKVVSYSIMSIWHGADPVSWKSACR